MLFRDEVRMAWMAWMALKPVCGTLANHEMSGIFGLVSRILQIVFVVWPGVLGSGMEKQGTRNVFYQV
jgi:hypothetical protein